MFNPQSSGRGRLSLLAARVAPVLCAGAMCACSPSTGRTVMAKTATAPAASATNALAGTPMAAYGTALNKAKSVQSIVDKQAAAQRKAIDAKSH
jgi:hypothetical protein